jgi:hypothetical protein
VLIALVALAALGGAAWAFRAGMLSAAPGVAASMITRVG